MSKNNKKGSELSEETNITESQSSGEETAAPKQRKKKVLVSGAEFWTFEPETPGGDFNGVEFIGKYLSDVKREKDGANADKNPNEKAGAVMGYNFAHEETGVVYIIGNSHAIQKGLEKTGFNTDLTYCIEFLGKGVTSGNKPYNRFEVSVLED